MDAARLPPWTSTPARSRLLKPAHASAHPCTLFAEKRASPRLIPAVSMFLPSSLDQFSAVLTSANHTLKRALTDPRLFSGIGNAYSDEILFHAQLSPVLLTQRMKPEEIKRLYEATNKR